MRSIPPFPASSNWSGLSDYFLASRAIDRGAATNDFGHQFHSAAQTWHACAAVDAQAPGKTAALLGDVAIITQGCASHADGFV